MDARQVHAFRELLPIQSIDLLVRTALPGMLKITEVHVDISYQREALATGHGPQSRQSWPRILTSATDPKADAAEYFPELTKSSCGARLNA